MKTSLKISSRGEVGFSKGFLKAQRVVVPTFEIVDFPRIKLSDIKTRRFSVIDRY